MISSQITAANGIESISNNGGKEQIHGALTVEAVTTQKSGYLKCLLCQPKKRVI